MTADKHEQNEDALAQIEALDSVRILRMRHDPDNRFSAPFIKALNLALDEIEADGSARSAVITGARDKYFSNGLDLTWIAGRTVQEWGPFLESFVFLLDRVLTFPKPLVAAINGHAFAGGAFLACAADWRVMRSDRGWCCIPEIDLRLDLPPGHLALLSYVVGKRNCDRLSLTGERLTAAQALELGLVDETAEKDEVLPRAVEMAKRLGTKNQEQYARHKLNLRAEPSRALRIEDPEYINAMLKEKKFT